MYNKRRKTKYGEGEDQSAYVDGGGVNDHVWVLLLGLLQVKGVGGFHRPRMSEQRFSGFGYFVQIGDEWENEESTSNRA